MEIIHADITTFFLKCNHLFEEHKNEVCLGSDELLIKEEFYRNLYYEDQLFILMVIDDNGNPVGYSVNCLTYHLHFENKIVCYNDCIFIKKEFRKGLIGVKLIKETVREAKNNFCNVMSWGARSGSNLSKLLDKLGYNIKEIIYDKEI